MTDQQGQDRPDGRALVSAFAGHVSAARTGAGAKIMAAVLVAALAGGVVLGVGYMTRPSKKHPATTTAAAGRSVFVTASPRPATATAPPAPARTVVAQPVPTVTVQAPPVVQPAPVVQSAPAPVPFTVTPAPVARPPRAAPARARRFVVQLAPATPTSPSGPGRFAAVTGYGCQPTASATFIEHGRWTSGMNGFISVPAGGPRTSTCNGSFDAMAMSGSAIQGDPGNYALWIFRTGPVVRGLCHVDVYLPGDPRITHVGGNPAVYQVFDSAGTSGPQLGTFTIDQHSNRGRWASRHNWHITNGGLTVKLLSRGIDWSGNSLTHAHIAVSAVSLTCES